MDRDEVNNIITELWYDCSKTLIDIGIIIGYERKTVARIARKLKLVCPRPRMDIKRKNKIVELWNSGKNIHDIVEETGSALCSVIYVGKTYGRCRGYSDRVYKIKQRILDDDIDINYGCSYIIDNTWCGKAVYRHKSYCEEHFKITHKGY